MRGLRILAVVLLTVAGCSTVRPKNDNPVMQPPPRRVSLDDSHTSGSVADHAGPAEVKTASATDEEDDSRVFNAKVVARVNGAPVFAGEVLERYGPYLQTARNKLTPEQFQELRTSIIQRDLRGHIERRLLAERMRSSLKPDQVKQLEAHVEKLFEKEVTRLKHELKVSTRTELELALNERGTTLDAIKEGFITQRLAVEYVASHIERPAPITRPELVEYYQSHLSDYEIPARAQWQQIQVSWNQRQSFGEAEKKIGQARDALALGQSFEAVVKQFSDGPTASSEGRWDWTSRGSLAEVQVEEAIFTLPIGQPSPVIQGKSAFHIVKVLDRQAQTHHQFFDVQDEIAQKLEAERQQNLPQKFVEQLYNEAIIETPYDLSDPSPT